MKPKIFLFCLATGEGSGIVNGSTPGGDVLGCALAEDGEGLAQHLSSSESFSRYDMGLTSTRKHDVYEAKYPDGYELEWIVESDLDGHAAFQAAWTLNQLRPDVDDAVVQERPA